MKEFSQALEYIIVTICGPIIKSIFSCCLQTVNYLPAKFQVCDIKNEGLSNKSARTLKFPFTKSVPIRCLVLIHSCSIKNEGFS